MDFSLPSVSRPMWALAGAARWRQTRPILGGAAASPPAAPHAAARLPKPTRVSALGAKFCFGRQTERLVQTSIFNLDEYPWQLRYYFKPFPFSRLQVERKIEKKTPSPPHHPLTACDKVGHSCLLISPRWTSQQGCSPSAVISVGLSRNRDTFRFLWFAVCLQGVDFF